MLGVGLFAQNSALPEIPPSDGIPGNPQQGIHALSEQPNPYGWGGVMGPKPNAIAVSNWVTRSARLKDGPSDFCTPGVRVRGFAEAHEIVLTKRPFDCQSMTRDMFRQGTVGEVDVGM
jgi:hypothetical protein